jgi:PQQ-dependent dehydrogenase (methanol/ethanol family)
MKASSWRAPAAVLVVVVAISLAVACERERAHASSTTPLTDAELLRAATDSADWLMYGGNYSNTRYSGLAQITPANVSELKPHNAHGVGVRWRDRLGTGWRQGEPKPWYRPAGWHPAQWGDEKQLSTPLAIDGVLYYTGAYGVAVAVDARTSKELWRYNHKMKKPPLLCCGPSNRGLAAYGNKVFLATLDAHLVALDRATGSVAWDVEVAPADSGYSQTMAPLAVDGMVIVGASGAEFGIRGIVDAYDAETGKRRWRFWTIPAPEEGGWWGRWASTTPDGDPLPRDIRAERADSARYPDSWRTGGGSVWMTPAYDPDLGLLYVGVGNPSPVLDDSTRPGDNLYTSSVVALDLATGTHRWHYQFLPHDMWDTDVQSPIVLFDLPQGDSVTRALGLASELGWVYILDRTTGRRLRRSEPFAPQRNLFVRPTPAGAIMYPAVHGAATWAPPAYSPRSGLLFVAGQHQPALIRLARGRYGAGRPTVGGEVLPPGEEDKADTAYGILSAVDPATGRIRWQHRTDVPLVHSGVLATAGGVLFYGDDDGFLTALDERNGKVLQRWDVGAKVEGPPISFTLDGHQQVAAVSRRGLYMLRLD